MDRKQRVLMVNEFSYLSTGYSTYGREVLTRLHASDKYEVAEFATYIDHEDKRVSTIPWTVFCNAPLNGNSPNFSQEDQDIYNSNPINAFGAWRFEDVCLSFKPDIVFDIRDFWMMSFESNSPFRKNFKWAVMPTVDAAPQNEQWLSTYCSADSVLTYQDWSGKVLEEETGGKCDWRGSASPAAADCFIPMAHRTQIKESLGLGPDVKVVGTVMRNQRRKLYPELFAAFRKYLDETGDDNTVLYCHTSFPDRGWDLPYHIMKNRLSSKVFFTYVCGTCGFSYGCTFQDAKTRCPNCGGHETGLANVKRGVQPEKLAEIYNMFDVYVQYANCEGFGIPMVEAAACGVPVMATDYSAMTDVVRKVNGFPIPVKMLYCEMETGCNRAYPDGDKLVELLTDFLRQPTSMRDTKRMQTRMGYVNNYSWDRAADKWMEVFDSLGYGDWDSPARILKPAEPNDQLQNMTNSEYAKWLIANVLCEPEKLNSYMFTRLVRDLNYEAYIEGVGGLYFDEQSFIFSQGQYQQFNREIAYNQMAQLCHRRNQWEQKRVQGE
jgi:glycosyltransferase involved in cell wall biosynthesis